MSEASYRAGVEKLKDACTKANEVVQRIKAQGPASVGPDDHKLVTLVSMAAVPSLVLQLIEDAARAHIELNSYQLKALLEMSEQSDTPAEDPVVICMGGEGSHSGAGLYAYWRECPEEGAVFIGENEEDQQRGDKLAEAFEAAQEIQP